MEKFISPSLPPEGRERELLTILAEEGCEVGQRATKALRFGIGECQPGQNLTNAERIAQEIGDILAVVKLLEDEGTLTLSMCEHFAAFKREKLIAYLQT